MLEPQMILERPAFISADEGHLIDLVNQAASRVASARLTEVRGSDFPTSKIAWKLKTYQNGLLYRSVALFRGAVAALNGASPLAAMLAGRALMETVALLGELLLKTRATLFERGLEEFDAWLIQRVFATRKQALLARHDEFPPTPATSILTILSRFEDKYPDAQGFRANYDELSEFCHPNSYGHTFMFGQLDTQNHLMRYSIDADPEGTFSHILTALMTIDFVDLWLDELEQQVAAIVDLGSGRPR